MGIFIKNSGTSNQNLNTTDSPKFANADIGNGFIGSLAHVYCAGDSLIKTAAFVDRLKADLGVGYAVYNRGVDGRTADGVRTNFAGDVTVYGNANYVIVWAGINDIAADLSAADIESDLQAVYTAAKATGATVITINVTPFKTSTSWSAGRQVVCDAVNTWIASAAATGVDYKYNAYSALKDPGVADTLLAANDSGDHLHLSTVGYNLVADAIYAAVTWSSSSSTHGIIDLPLTTGEYNGVVYQGNDVLLSTFTPTGTTGTARNLFIGTGPDKNFLTLTSTTAGNVAIGYGSHRGATSALYDTAVGWGSQYNVTAANSNTSMGYASLSSNVGRHE